MARGWLAFFATGADQPELADKDVIDRQYRKHRLRVMFVI